MKSISNFTNNMHVIIMTPFAIWRDCLWSKVVKRILFVFTIMLPKFY